MDSATRILPLIVYYLSTKFDLCDTLENVYHMVLTTINKGFSRVKFVHDVIDMVDQALKVALDSGYVTLKDERRKFHLKSTTDVDKPTSYHYQPLIGTGEPTSYSSLMSGKCLEQVQLLYKNFEKEIPAAYLASFAPTHPSAPPYLGETSFESFNEYCLKQLNFTPSQTFEPAEQTPAATVGPQRKKVQKAKGKTLLVNTRVRKPSNVPQRRSNIRRNPIRRRNGPTKSRVRNSNK